MSSFARCVGFSHSRNSHELHEKTFINLSASQTLMEYPTTTTTANLHLYRCMMTPPATPEILVGGSNRPLAVSTALFGMTLFLIYLIILFPRPFLLSPDRAIVEAFPPTIPLTPTLPPQTVQKKPEQPNLYKNLNDTYSRTQIPFFNIPYLYKTRIKLYMPWKSDLDYGLNNWTTEGYSIMYFTVKRTNQRLQVHCANLHIGDVFIHDDFERNISITEISRNFPHVLDIHTEHELIENMNYSLHVYYTGKIALGKEKTGLHASVFKEDNENKYTVSTHCQTQEARTVLPCLDVPEAKAKFLLTLVHPAGTNAVANAQEVARSFDGEWATTKFEPSPRMSSYLLAFAVSNFPFIETTYRDIKIRLFAEKSMIDQATLALDIVPIVIEHLENYFTIPIPLKKLDIHEVPQLTVRAMENWGLITSQPRGLFYNKNTSAAADRFNVVITMAHEITHQWFGNLVTMKWWNNLWLNEGFATMIGTKVAAKLGEFQWDSIPKMAITLRLQQERPTAISHPELPTFAPDKMFEEAYTKPSIIMKMVERIIGEESFRLGVIRFLKRFAYSNADHEDLMEALSYAHDSSSGTQLAGQTFTLTNVIEQWIYNYGYPVITLKTREDGLVVASQSAAYKGPAQEIAKQQWTIPLFLRDPITKEQKVEWLGVNKTAVFDLGDNVVLDANANAFVRIRYDTHLYQRIGSTLRSNPELIPFTSRARLMDDAFTAAERGELTYRDVFRIVSYLCNETNYGPVAIFHAHLDFLNSRFNIHENFHLLKNYVAALLGPIYLRQKSPAQISENDEHLFDILCRRTCIAGFLPCVNEAKEAVEKLKQTCDSNPLSSSCNSIPKFIRRCYYATAVMYGQQDTFDFFYNHHLTEEDTDEQNSQWLGMVASREKDNLWKSWDRMLFDQLKSMNHGRLTFHCGEYTKYYPINHTFASYLAEKAEQIVELVNQKEMPVIFQTMLRTLYSSSHKTKYDHVMSALRKKFPALPLPNFARVEQVEWFRSHHGEIISQALTEELATLEAQPMI